MEGVTTHSDGGCSTSVIDNTTRKEMEGVTTHSDGSACSSGASVDSKTTFFAANQSAESLPIKHMEGVTLHSDVNWDNTQAETSTKREMEGCTTHSDGSK